MTTTWTFNDQKKLVVKGIPLELINRLEEAGGTIKGDTSTETFVNYDTEMAKFIMKFIRFLKGYVKTGELIPNRS